MPIHDVESNIKLSKGCASTAYNSTTGTGGEVIDLSGYTNVSYAFYKTIVATSVALKLQESASTGSTTFTDVTGASLAASTAVGIARLHLPNPTQRYVRSLVVCGATTPHTVIGIAALGGVRSKPVSY